MSKQPPQITTVFVDRGDATCKPAAPANSPKVGIWWAEGKRIAAMLQSAAEVRTSEPHVDSDLEHWREWRTVANHFGLKESDDYFDVPRGRVLLNRKTGRGVIYHGNKTEQGALRRIAQLFGQRTWDSQIDEHYLMGTEIDGLFDDDFE